MLGQNGDSVSMVAPPCVASSAPDQGEPVFSQDEGCVALSLALAPHPSGVNTALDTLVLWGNNIELNGAKALADALTLADQEQFSLDLSCTPFLTFHLTSPRPPSPSYRVRQFSTTTEHRAQPHPHLHPFSQNDLQQTNEAVGDALRLLSPLHHRTQTPYESHMPLTCRFSGDQCGKRAERRAARSHGRTWM
jgi:hypothetical protein